MTKLTKPPLLELPFMKLQTDMKKMMDLFGQTTRRFPEDPKVSDQEAKLRHKLIEEESQELLVALESGHLPSIAHELVDVLVVTIGTANNYGIELDDLWNAVMKANLAKVGGPKDPVTGKQLKPKDWQPANIKAELRNQGWNG